MERLSQIAVYAAFLAIKAAETILVFRIFELCAL